MKMKFKGRKEGRMDRRKERKKKRPRKATYCLITVMANLDTGCQLDTPGKRGLNVRIVSVRLVGMSVGLLLGC